MPGVKGKLERAVEQEKKNMLIISDQYKEKVNLATIHGQVLRDEHGKVLAL